MDTVSRFLELLTEEEATAILHSNVSPMLRGELRVVLGAARNRALARLNDEMRVALAKNDPAPDRPHDDECITLCNDDGCRIGHGCWCSAEEEESDAAFDPKYTPCWHGKPHGVCSVCFPAVPS